MTDEELDLLCEQAKQRVSDFIDQQIRFQQFWWIWKETGVMFFSPPDPPPFHRLNVKDYWSVQLKDIYRIFINKTP